MLAPSCHTRKASSAVVCSTSAAVDSVPECPDFVSYRSITGRPEEVALCNIAVIFLAWEGSTRVSPSPVISKTAGYLVPFRT